MAGKCDNVQSIVLLGSIRKSRTMTLRQLEVFLAVATLRGRPRMTRGRCGALRLHRMTLSFTTPRRFNPAHEETVMLAKQPWIVVLLLTSLFAGVRTAQAAEKECDRWLKLVDGELRERKEALEKAAGAKRQRLQETVARAAGPIAEAKKSCASGNDKAATLRALELWDALVEEERQDGSLSLNSRLTIIALRAERLRAFQQKGWKPKISAEAQQSFLAELDKLDRVLADALKQGLH